MTHAPDDTPRAGTVSLLPATKRILELIAAGASLTDTLTTLCAAIDAQNPDMMSMVSLMDPDGQRLWPVAAPHVPAEFVEAITAEQSTTRRDSSAPFAGLRHSCGTRVRPVHQERGRPQARLGHRHSRTP
jgi:hypothetical protein